MKTYEQLAEENRDLLEALKAYNMIDWTLIVGDLTILNTDPQARAILERLHNQVNDARTLGTNALAKAEGKA